MLLRLHHSRHSRQLASCVKDLGPKIFRAGLRGDVRFRVSAGLAKIERNRVRYEQNRVQYEQNRVVYKIEPQGRVYPVCS